MRDTTPWAISVGDSIQVRQLIVTGEDGHALFQVSDGSTFEVFPNSQVVFRKNPPTWKDLIDLLVGRVRVQIEHMGTIPNPTRMLTPTAVISVRGTIFDVSVDSDDESTVVEVEEGVVEVRHALLPSEGRTLTTGESIKVNKNEPIAQGSNKGTIARQVLHMAMDLAVTIGRPGVGTIKVPSSSPGGGAKVPPPPPPPPPPAPPAVH
jgi:hypothetical protein